MRVATLSIVALCLVSAKEVKDAFKAKSRYVNTMRIIDAVRLYYSIEAENNLRDFTSIMMDTTDPVMTYRIVALNKEVVKRISVTHKVVKLEQKKDTLVIPVQDLPIKEDVISSPNIIVDPKKIIKNVKIIVTKAGDSL